MRLDGKRLALLAHIDRLNYLNRSTLPTETGAVTELQEITNLLKNNYGDAIMDMTELVMKAAKIFMNSKQSGDTGSRLDIGNLTAALSNLAGGSSGGGVDFGALLSKMDANGLGAVAQSWLGDGSNEAISTDQVSELFGANRVSEFASELGLSTEEATGGLSEALPHMVDQASSGGALLDSIGGISGAIGLAGKLFGR